MNQFICAAELKKLYTVYGHFYDIEFESEILPCRSVLEIIDKNTILENSNPDAVFIMMNPGSSRPLKGSPDKISYKNIQSLKINLVDTKPDTTQYQIMRVMHYKNWKHVRVLNLSDLRNPKSNNFYNHFSSIEKEYDKDIHSIFSCVREQELLGMLYGKKSVIAAWGVSNKLDPLICRCVNQLEKHNKEIIGLNKTDNYYFHPLPTLQKDKKKWVDDILKIL